MGQRAEGNVDLPRRVLIVDPDTRSRRDVAQACRQDGFEVVEVGTGEDGLARFRELRPSVVVLEANLPDVSGFEVCRELRRMTDEVPIILISSSHDEVDVVVGLEIGADDYVT